MKQNDPPGKLNDSLNDGEIARKSALVEIEFN